MIRQEISSFFSVMVSWIIITIPPMIMGISPIRKKTCKPFSLSTALKVAGPLLFVPDLEIPGVIASPCTVADYQKASTIFKLLFLAI